MKLWAMPYRAIQRQMGYSEEFWQNVVHWRKEGQLILVFLPREPHEQYEKARRYDTGRWAPQVRSCSVCYWGSAEGIIINNSFRKNEADG